jgi:hypothetical protein
MNPTLPMAVPNHSDLINVDRCLKSTAITLGAISDATANMGSAFDDT